MQALEQSACIVSCGGAPLPVIKQYVNQQHAVTADQPTPPSEPLRACTESTGVLTHPIPLTALQKDQPPTQPPRKDVQVAVTIDVYEGRRGVPGERQRERRIQDENGVGVRR